MKKKERAIKEAVYMERFRIVTMIQEEYADEMSDDLAILQTVLTDQMLDLGIELGWVKTISILGKSGITYEA